MNIIVATDIKQTQQTFPPLSCSLGISSIDVGRGFSRLRRLEDEEDEDALGAELCELGSDLRGPWLYPPPPVPPVPRPAAVTAATLTVAVLRTGGSALFDDDADVAKIQLTMQRKVP